jgi:diguanylate cyclase (GGDEF)-like protein
VPFAYGAPIVVLATLCWRMSLPQVALVSVASMAIYLAALRTATFVPSAQMPLLVMEDFSLASIALVIAIRIDLRDRQVFLLGRQADIGRELLAAQNRTLAKLSQIDALTGVGNRRCFDEALNVLWEPGAARPESVALVMFDIDHFKSFNDTAGHQSGDDCLLAVARAAATCVRDGVDTLARYGGEEFGIILPSASLEDGRIIAERVREAILARAIPHPGVRPEGYVTVSLGVATILPATGSAASLVEAADRCLYAAKRLGRNRVATDDRPALGIQGAALGGKVSGIVK